MASLAVLLLMTSCKESQEEVSRDVSPADGSWLLQVGSEVITEADLALYLDERFEGRSDEATRNVALEELTERARYVAAAREADLVSDAIVKAEVARVLKNRYRELHVFPKVKELGSVPVSEGDLREVYEKQKERFQSGEKRQAAVLWLNPGADPKRRTEYQEKLEKARAWVEENDDLQKAPQDGFSVLSVDHSEHAASRFKGGIVGWMEESGGADEWSKAVSEIVFSLEKPGEISEVVSRGEGLFLVRYVDIKPAVIRPFETVKGELERNLRRGLRDELEEKLEEEMVAKFPVKKRSEN